MVSVSVQALVRLHVWGVFDWDGDWEQQSRYRGPNPVLRGHARTRVEMTNYRETMTQIRVTWEMLVDAISWHDVTMSLNGPAPPAQATWYLKWV